MDSVFGTGKLCSQFSVTGYSTLVRRERSLDALWDYSVNIDAMRMGTAKKDITSCWGYHWVLHRNSVGDEGDNIT